MSYKQLLIEAKKLHGKAGLGAYQRAKILVQVFDDRDFRADHGNLDDFQAADLLSEHVSDLCLGFLELRAMLAHFPSEADWKNGNLRRMHAEMLEANRPVREPATPQARRTVKLSEHEKVVSELRQAESRVSNYTSELTRLREKCAALEQEVAALRRQNKADAERIAELESLLEERTELAAA